QHLWRVAHRFLALGPHRRCIRGASPTVRSLVCKAGVFSLNAFVLCRGETLAHGADGNPCTRARARPRVSRMCRRHAFRSEPCNRRSKESAMENRVSGSRSRNGNFGQQAEEIGEQAMHQLERLRDEASHLGERVVAFIKERPGTSLLIAAAAGYLI